MEKATNAEYFLLRKKADEYRDQGYEVSLDSALDFLPSHSPDLIVRKDGATKVVEGKSRSSLATNPKIRSGPRLST